MEAQAPRSGVTLWARRVGIAALIVGLVYLMIAIWDRDALVRWTSDTRPVPFFLAMALLPALGAPLTPFMVVAGAAFGFWGGLIGSLAAIALNLCIVYAIAHGKLRPRIVALFERFEHHRVRSYSGGGLAAWRFAAAMKLTPVLPAFVKTYVLAVTAVPFPIYFIVSFVISGAFAAAWNVLGDSLLAHDVSHSTVAALAIVVLAVIALLWWRGRREVSGDAPAAA
jgi:uncharacterized membrane protein YdjX (TVP38/TMEM64 family)